MVNLFDNKPKPAIQDDYGKSTQKAANPFAALAATVKQTAPQPTTQTEHVLVKAADTVIEELQQTPVAPVAVSAAEFNSPDQPDMLEPQAILELQQCMALLVASFEHKELVSDAIRSVLIHVKKYPFLKDILLPEDCQLMVRALRESYGVAIVSKTVRAKKVSANQKDVTEVEDVLADLGL